MGKACVVPTLLQRYIANNSNQAKVLEGMNFANNFFFFAACTVMVLNFHSKREYKIQTYLYVINYNLISTVDWVICDFMIKAAMRVHLVRSTTELGTFCRYVKSTSPSFSQLITHLFADEP